MLLYAISHNVLYTRVISLAQIKPIPALLKKYISEQRYVAEICWIYEEQVVGTTSTMFGYQFWKCVVVLISERFIVDWFSTAQANGQWHHFLFGICTPAWIWYETMTEAALIQVYLELCWMNLIALIAHCLQLVLTE